MIMLINPFFDMPHLSGGWIILAEEKCLLKGMEINLCKTFERNKLFVRMEKIGDLLFQLMKHGTTTLHFKCIVFVQYILFPDRERDVW
jgi:hypothetical protein